MEHKLRLGPIAVFLAVVAIVLTTLATLTFATSRADLVLAERFAQVTGIRYALETDGNRLLQEAGDAVSAGRPLGTVSDLEETENGTYRYEKEQDGYNLQVLLREEDGVLVIEKWKISKVWNSEDLSQDIWLG